MINLVYEYFCMVGRVSSGETPRSRIARSKGNVCNFDRNCQIPVSIA